MGEGLDFTINPGRVLAPQESEEISKPKSETFVRPDESVLARFKDTVGFPKKYPNLAANAPWVRWGGSIAVPQLELTPNPDLPKPPKIAARFKTQDWLLESDMKRAELRDQIQVIEADLQELAQEIEVASPIGRAILIARSAYPKKEAEKKLQVLKNTLRLQEQKRDGIMSAREQAKLVFENAKLQAGELIWEEE